MLKKINIRRGKTRRKILSIALMISLLAGMMFMLAGCGADKDGETKQKNNSKNQGTRLADVVEIGDYVNYDANSGLTTPVTYKTDSTLTGTSASSTYSSSDTVKWRVLSVDKDSGKVELIAENNLRHLQLDGITGYVNAEDVLNGIGAVYGHGKGAVSGRSVNIEDIEKYSSFNPATDYNNRSSSNGTVGGTGKYTSGTFIKGEGITGGTESNSDSRLVIASGSNPVTVTHTFYNYNKPSNYFENQKAYDVLLSDRSFFWLASNCVSLGYSGCTFFVLYASTEGVSGSNLYSSDDWDSSCWWDVVPVVSLESNILTSGKDESGAWNLKVE